MKAVFTVSLSALVLAVSLLTSTSASAADEAAAKELARANNCFKCHAINKDKDGPAYSKIAEKYRGKAEAPSKLVNHLTSGEMAKFPDGHEEKHKIIKTDPANDTKQVQNLVDWILSLQ